MPRTRELVACLALALMTLLTTAPASGQRGEVRAHDPTIIRAGEVYYLFSTGRGIPFKRSADLVTWEEVGRVFEGLPEWVPDEVPEARGSLWAPDISHFNGRYHLYYSVSSFGSQRSAIGLATNETLDPSDARYEWRDHGVVIRSVPEVSTFNAIDPNLALDENGDPWLSWGSFWGGIKMRRIDPATGLLSDRDTTLYSLAARLDPDVREGPDDMQAIEAPAIVRRGEHFYLFASYDMCCRGVRSSYNIRVGRSERITGPYVDERGESMTRGGGDVVLSTLGRVRGPGHNSILQQGEDYYLVHHFYDAGDEGRSKLQIRPITWREDGWPVAEEPLSPPD